MSLRANLVVMNMDERSSPDEAMAWPTEASFPYNCEVSMCTNPAANAMAMGPEASLPRCVEPEPNASHGAD